MELPQWREQLKAALHRQRLPMAEVERLIEELSDHAADLVMEAQSMDALPVDLEVQLGSPESVAAAATEQLRQRSFAGRHPALTFLVGPFVCLIGGMAAVILLLIPVVYLAEILSGNALSATDMPHTPPAAWEMAFVQAVNLIFTYLPLVIATWWLTRLGHRTGRTGWSTVSCAIRVTWALFFSSVVRDLPDGHGAWIIGFGTNIGLAQLLQAAVPLTLGAWARLRSASSSHMATV